MVKTAEVFTPSKTPTHTSVTRKELWAKVEGLAEQGGAFISVMGTTKLGKSTLVKSVMQTAAFHAYIPGQTVTEGAGALWSRLASDLGIPASTTSGTVSGDKSKWGFFGRFGISVPGFTGGGGSSVGGEHSIDTSKGATYEMDAPSAVTEALTLLAQDAREKNSQPPIIVIDDFHFVMKPEKRRELILALRPMTDADVTVILATLPGREDDAGFDNTNVSGRHYPVDVPLWDGNELREIATTGFKTLNLAAATHVVNQLIEQSYGSPQIMQQLCLNLCRITNHVKDDNSGVSMLDEPEDWSAFYRLVKDPQSTSWLRKLGVGLTARRPRTSKAELPDGRTLDGYQLILWALHEMGAPSEASFVAVRAKIDELASVKKLGVNRFGLEQKARSMNVVASREMSVALSAMPADEDDDAADEESDTPLFTEDEIRLAALIPQPVFEVVGDKASNMQLRILDPLLAYTLNWHPEVFANRR